MTVLRQRERATVAVAAHLLGPDSLAHRCWDRGSYGRLRARAIGVHRWYWSRGYVVAGRW